MRGQHAGAHNDSWVVGSPGAGGRLTPRDAGVCGNTAPALWMTPMVRGHPDARIGWVVGAGHEREKEHEMNSSDATSPIAGASTESGVSMFGEDAL